MARVAMRVVAMLLLGSAMRMTAEARPAEYAEYLGLDTDMATVGSLRREVRQPAPVVESRQATEVADLLSSSNAPKKHMKNASGKSDEGGLFKTFGSDAEGEKGYLKKSYSKGDHGYKTLDTFHKKLGDKYGFEEHEAFGKENGDEQQQHQGKSAKSTRKHKQNGDHEGAGTDLESHYAADDGGDYGGNENYGDGESGSYDNGGSEGYSESYSSDGDGDGNGGETYASGESYSSDGESSAEDDGGSY